MESLSTPETITEQVVAIDSELSNFFLREVSLFRFSLCSPLPARWLNMKTSESLCILWMFSKKQTVMTRCLHESVINQNKNET